MMGKITVTSNRSVEENIWVLKVNK